MDGKRKFDRRKRTGQRQGQGPRGNGLPLAPPQSTVSHDSCFLDSFVCTATTQVRHAKLHWPSDNLCRDSRQSEGDMRQVKGRGRCRRSREQEVCACLLSIFAMVSNGVDTCRQVPLCWHASQCPMAPQWSMPLADADVKPPVTRTEEGGWGGLGGLPEDCQQVGVFFDVAYRAVCRRARAASNGVERRGAE